MAVAPQPTKITEVAHEHKVMRDINDNRIFILSPADTISLKISQHKGQVKPNPAYEQTYTFLVLESQSSVTIPLGTEFYQFCP